MESVFSEQAWSRQPNGIWVFWSERDDVEQLQNHFSFTADVVTKRMAIKERVKIALQHVEKLSCNYLIQYWASIVIDGQTFLTTSDQPFGLTRLEYGLCSYRKKCLSHAIPVELKNGTQCENDFGPPGRVFKHRLPELCTDVKNYSQQEFPLRDDAVAWGIQWCYTVPVFDSSRDTFVGVLELVTSHQTNKWIFQNSVLPIFKTLQVLDDRQCALGGLYKAIEVVCQKHQFLFAQIWVSVADSWCTGKAITVRQRHIAINDNQNLSLFKYASGLQYILEGYGVVGRAFSSKSSCFCRDVTQLSIIEYPLVTCAREAGLTGCFAICLSAPGNDDNIYILEFFLPPNELLHWNLQDFVKLVLDTVKQQLHRFKVAVGHDFGEKLPVEVIKISSDDELDSFDICQTTKELHNVEPLPNGGELMLLDTPNQQSFSSETNQQLSLDIDEINAARDSIAVSEELCNSAGSSTSAETSQNKERKLQLELSTRQAKQGANAVNKRKNGIRTLTSESEIQKERERIERDHNINLKKIEDRSSMTQDAAADDLGVGKSTLKRICRLYGITRWPPKNKEKKRKCSHSRKMKSILPAEEDVNASTKFQQSSDSPNKEDTINGAKVGAHVTEIRDGTAVITKVKYGDRMLKLQLTLSSMMKDLEEEVAKRVESSIESFDFTYVDKEGDTILIKCDEDLTECFLHCRSSENATVKMFITPKS
ncbi:protein NLP6-like isoform X3 [Nicotiana tomentosiformis]|uniref:protein NLP6-like isoform X3 n=1 Tax=Nicotiana tomentosiformis TaxID=4098 RepID=UPI0008780C1B|nr:protein NLP7-like isoform X3 [Nicotiana tomentosiformis]